MNDQEKIEKLEKRIKSLEISRAVQIVVFALSVLGVISLFPKKK